MMITDAFLLLYGDKKIARLSSLQLGIIRDIWFHDIIVSLPINGTSSLCLTIAMPLTLNRV
jgi:hypothetical protein